MARIPEKFPCERHGKYVTLDGCAICSRQNKCDVYITMLNETEYEEDESDE